MQISVTGGTGFVGRTLCPRLRAAGYSLRLVRRSPPANSGARNPQNEIQFADFRSVESLAAAFSGSQAVIHLVGIIREFRRDSFQEVHVRLTETVLAAARTAGVQRFLHMSALGARPAARARYHRSKWAAEERVRGSGLAWTIFRPSLIHGPEDEFTNLFAQLAKWSPVMPVMGDGRHLVQPVGVWQVVTAFAGAMTQPASVGRTYDLCGMERLSFNGMLGAILAALRRHRPLLHLPMPLARFQAGVMEFVFPALLRRPSPLNQDQLVMLNEDNVGNGGPADRDFGLVHEPFSIAMEKQFRDGWNAGPR